MTKIAICTPAEKLEIRNERGEWQATLFLDNERGQISIISQYGNFGYWWTSMGKGRTLKQFLIGCDHDYIMTKFEHGQDSWFDSEATVKVIEMDIFRERRARSLSADQAREFYDECSNLKEVRTASEMMSVLSPGMLENLYENDYMAVPYKTDHQPQTRGFMRYVWPIFIEHIKKETEKNNEVSM